MRRNVRLEVAEVKRKGLCPPVGHIERLIKKVGGEIESFFFFSFTMKLKCFGVLITILLSDWYL